MHQYLNLLENIIDNGVEKESGRANMPNTIGISHGEIEMNLLEGFPLLTTKKMYWKGIVHELLWFLRGDTNIKYLVDNNVNIWNDDAYRWYLKFRDANPPIMKDGKEINNLNTIEYFTEVIKTGIGIAHLDVRGQDWFPGYKLGDLGKVYGYQWRNQNGVDQIKEVLDGLKSNPYSRYHIIDAWNKADFKDMALPPCHLLYQFIVRPLSQYERVTWIMIQEGVDETNPNSSLYGYNINKPLDFDNHPTLTVPKFYLDLNMYQRSCDTFLGVPFNIASMSLLLMLFAEVSDMIPGMATWIGGDTHLYVDHIPMVMEQLGRAPYDLPKMLIKKDLNSLEDILALTIDDFELVDYKCYDAIKAELFTGLKKK
jgi:thymidylate synthase